MKNLLLLFSFLFIITNTHAQLNPQAISIPMRDGNNLSAHLFLPNMVDTFPIILIQTPYNKNFYQFTGLPLGIGYDIANSNYGFVVLDWRCFYGSFSACTAPLDRGNDGYDAVEWVAQQTWCNGKVGTWGPSALGNIQFLTAKKRPPSLVCAVPEVAEPQTRYHNYYPGGALETEYFKTLSVLFGTSLALYPPHYNFLWQIVENGTMYPDSIEIPMLLVGGWYDHNIYEDLILVDTLRKNSAPAVRDQHKILVGPWVHGGSGQATVGSSIQGELMYPQAEFHNDSIELQFFDYYMRNLNNGYNNNARYTYFQMGENVWETSADWPPTGLQNYSFYLHQDNSIQDAMPTAPSASLSYDYDPNDPSPTVGGKTLGLTTDQGPYNQADTVENRNDILIFTTAPFTQDVIIKGRIQVNLFVESDRVDTDIAVRLTEVYPDNRSMLLSHGIQRMRFREGYYVADTVMMTPGQVYPITIELDDIGTTFKVGQRLRILITSSNYPVYNRNMNTGEEMYPDNNPDTLVNPLVAHNTIHLSSTYPSNIVLPLFNYTPTGISLMEEKQVSFSIYPNPSNGLVQLYLEQMPLEATVRVYDILGHELLQMPISQQVFSLDLKAYPAGLYFVAVQDRFGKVETKELILEN